MNRERGGVSAAWKAFAIFLAIVLVAAGILTGVFYALGDITFGKAEEQSEAATKNGGMVLAADEGSGAVVAMSAIAEENFGDYGISESAESAELVTATLDPADATYTTANWSAAWANAESEWASGKTVTDYVTVTPTEDNDLSAAVACLQPFGEQVVVTLAIGGGNNTMSASCIADYAQRIDESSILFKIGDRILYTGEFPNETDMAFVFALDDSEEAEGGLPEVTYDMLDEPYTIAQEFEASLQFSDPQNPQDLGISGVSTVFTIEYGTPPASLYYEGLIWSEGMYFSFPFLCENMGLMLKEDWGGGTNYYDVSEKFSTAGDLASALNELRAGSAPCLYLFDIELTLESTYASYTYTINFGVSLAREYIVSVELDEDSVVF